MFGLYNYVICTGISIFPFMDKEKTTYLGISGRFCTFSSIELET